MGKDKWLLLTFCSNGKQLCMGSGQDIWISSVAGLEATDYSIVCSNNSQLDGGFVASRQMLPRVIEVTFSHTNGTEEDLQRISSFFNPKHSGTLTVDWAFGKRMIDYDVKKFRIVRRDNLWSKYRLEVELLCADPVFYSTDNFGKNLAGVIPMFAFPLAIKKSGSVVSCKIFNQESNFFNNGDLKSGIMVKFIAQRGTVTNPRFANLTNGGFIQIGTTARPFNMKVGDELIIDTRTRSKAITLNGENAYLYINRQSTSLELDVGDNILRYDAAGNMINLDVFLYYTPQYLGCVV